MKSNPILITGINGFLGSHIANELISAGYKDVRGTVRANSNLSLINNIKDNIKLYQGDITDISFLDECISECPYVMHNAAMVSYDPRKSKELYKINAEGTANVVNACLVNNTIKLVHVSSIAALGKGKPGELIDENTKWVNSTSNTSYSNSKFLSENEAWRGYYEGLPITVLNPSLILGVGNWDNTSIQIVKRIYHNSRFYALGGTGIVDVKDVARSCVLALAPEFNGKKYIISAENILYKDLISRIAIKLGVKPPTIGVTPIIGVIAVALENITSRIANRPPLLTSQSIKNTASISLYDNKKSIEELGLSYHSVEQTLVNICNAFMKDVRKK